MPMKNREGLPVTREQSWLAVGKVLPELFPGRKTSGFHGCCAPGTSSMTCAGSPWKTARGCPCPESRR